MMNWIIIGGLIITNIIFAVENHIYFCKQYDLKFKLEELQKDVLGFKKDIRRYIDNENIKIRSEIHLLKYPQGKIIDRILFSYEEQGKYEFYYNGNIFNVPYYGDSKYEKHNFNNNILSIFFSDCTLFKFILENDKLIYIPSEVYEVFDEKI